ncbi:MAG: DUF4870 domain-containing protein [Tannerellaceae bacterium]|nr:DUF4870 domain-containing protein [Tannerellaceae bacterium]
MNNIQSPYGIPEEDAEKASYAYLISTVIMVAAVVIPLLNMFVTFMFYVANRKRSYFVRFHCLQSVLSQVLIFGINTVAVWWSLLILFQKVELSNFYFGYLFTTFIFNLVEFVVSLCAAIQTRKGKDFRYFAFGALTEVICKP